MQFKIQIIFARNAVYSRRLKNLKIVHRITFILLNFGGENVKSFQENITFARGLEHFPPFNIQHL
jgi:hypothetical protein